MKRRPDSTTSERELVFALAESGRTISLATLAGWRKHGLLPALASHGSGAGRSYYWREPDILQQACAACDLLEQHCRTDMALRGLWLRGFHVPAVQLTRAWRQIGKLNRRWRPGVALSDKAASSPAITGTGAILIHATRLLGNTLAPDRRVATIIEQAAARLHGKSGQFDNMPGANLWALLQMSGLALETSVLMAEADDALLGEAQRYLWPAATLLEASAGGGAAWNGWLAERIGPPLALVILALLRSGQRATLDALVGCLEEADWPAGPARSIRHYAMA
jgi:hypothetical protein